MKYVLEELNVKTIRPCNDPLKYTSLRAEPDYSVLGVKLGKAMGAVAKEVKALKQADILAFESSGEATFSGHSLKFNEIKVCVISIFILKRKIWVAVVLE
ncbi:hypothetical protein KSP40_PGU014397 [Platanthera guangdongensis]|uniref:Uncharacterized protein n=1 Tax=Platanthera guangdongensis TaxID=2320717 RepID=A0ABR2MD97_9ASPA